MIRTFEISTMQRATATRNLHAVFMKRDGYCENALPHMNNL